MELPKHFNFKKFSGKAYQVCGNVISFILCAIQIRQGNQCNQSLSFSESFILGSHPQNELTWLWLALSSKNVHSGRFAKDTFLYIFYVISTQKYFYTRVIFTTIVCGLGERPVRSTLRAKLSSFILRLCLRRASRRARCLTNDEP